MTEPVTLLQVYETLAEMRGDIGELKGDVKQIASQDERIRKLERNQSYLWGTGTAFAAFVSVVGLIAGFLPK